MIKNTEKESAAKSGVVTLKPAKTAAKPRRAKVDLDLTAKVVSKSALTAEKTENLGADVSVVLKKPDFIDRVVERCDVKKRDAKPAIEAALAVLADALKSGTEVNLPPMGKIKIVKSKDIGNGAQVLTLKLRTMKDGAGQWPSKGEVSPDETSESDD